MDELRRLCLVAFCIHVVKSQPQEDVNTLLRQRPGFPAAVQRSFFNPVNDPRQSDQGVFTIDRHLEVPQSSVARGHSRFEMQGSRQGKTEATRIGQFSAAGVHPRMNGVMDHGGPSAVAQGQMEASKEAQLGASGQTEVTIEGEASVPTRRIGQFSAAGVHPGMTGVMDHGGPSGEAQGQMEASREAQLGTSGQTEVTVEGEASVPTRRIGQFSAAGIHPGMTGATTGVAQGQMEASREAQLGASGQTEVTVEGEALVPTRLLTGRRSGGVTGRDQMGLASSGQGRFGSMGQAATVDNVNRRLNQGQLEASSQAELAAGGQGEITVEGEVAVPTQVLDAAQRVRGGIVGGVGAGVGGTQTGEISGARAADVSVSQGGAISGSATGGQLGRTLKGQGVIGQRDIGSGGSLEITNQADVKAGGQGEVSIEGEIAVPTQMLNRAGGSFTQGSGGLHGTRGLSGTTGEQDVTRSQDSLGGRVLDFRGLGMSGNGQGQMSTSREGQLSSSRDARLSVGQSVGQLQTGGVREGQLSASNQVDMSAGGQGEVTIEGEMAVPKHLGSDQTGQLSANRDRDLRLGGSRDTTITGSRGGQIETSRKVGLGLSRDTQLDASRERQLMSGQTGQVSGTRDRDLRLGASRDTTITGPRGGQFEMSRKVGLGLSRDTQLDASRRRDQSVGQLTTGGMREGQLTASNQVDMSAGGKGEVIVEGEIAVPRRFVGGARQIGSGQTGQISGSRDRDLRVGTSRDTTITGPRGGQFEMSRKVGLGLSRDTQLDAFRERQIGGGQTGQISGSRDRDLRVGASRDTTIMGPRGRQIETSRKVGLGLSRDTQLDASGERQLMSGQTGQVSGTRDRDLRLGASRDTTITGPRGGQFETSRKVGLGLSRDTQLDASRRRDQSVGQLTTGGMREGQLTASNQVDMSAGGKGEVIVEGEIAVPRRFVGGARQVFDRGSRQDRVGFQRDRRLDLSGSRQTDISGQVSRHAGLSGQQTMGGLGGKHIDLTHLAGQVDQGISGSVDLTGQRERNLNRVGSGPSDRFPGLGQGTGRNNMGQRMENSDRFPIKHVCK